MQLFSTCQMLDRHCKWSVQLWAIFEQKKKTVKQAQVENMSAQHAMHIQREMPFFLWFVRWLWRTFSLWFANSHTNAHTYLCGCLHVISGVSECREVNAPRQHLIKCRSISAAFHLFIVKIVQRVCTQHKLQTTTKNRKNFPSRRRAFTTATLTYLASECISVLCFDKETIFTVLDCTGMWWVSCVHDPHKEHTLHTVSKIYRMFLLSCTSCALSQIRKIGFIYIIFLANIFPYPSPHGTLFTI